jgi:tRNA pseudouridine38-40 synthase
MRVFKLVLAYDGSNYSGWQVQPGKMTLQGALEEALARITGEPVHVAGSGRTDAGVHALGQVASFQSETGLSADVLHKALNAELPRDMAIVSVTEAAAGFHARASAIRKRYRYQLDDRPIRDVFSRRYAWHCRYRLDAAAMHRAAQPLVGRHDFCSFETSGSKRQSSVRTVFEISVQRRGDNEEGSISLEIEADGFLYNMVRTIVGTLVEVGRRVRGEHWPADVLAACDRKAAGQTAPACGLFLLRVDY